MALDGAPSNTRPPDIIIFLSAGGYGWGMWPWGCAVGSGLSVVSPCGRWYFESGTESIVIDCLSLIYINDVAIKSRQIFARFASYTQMNAVGSGAVISFFGSLWRMCENPASRPATNTQSSFPSQPPHAQNITGTI